MSKSDVTDFEKIFGALSFLKEIKDLNGILAVFGIDNLPTAQKYGIMFGCMTFTITVATVLTLLVMGGSFKRMTEQSQTGGASIPDAIEGCPADKSGKESHQAFINAPIMDYMRPDKLLLENKITTYHYDTGTYTRTLQACHKTNNIHSLRR